MRGGITLSKIHKTASNSVRDILCVRGCNNKGDMCLPWWTSIHLCNSESGLLSLVGREQLVGQEIIREER